MKNIYIIYICTVCLFRNSLRQMEITMTGSNHRQSFKYKKHKNGTALSSYLWDLKENHNQIGKLTWSFVGFAPGYLNISKRCRLSLQEKLLILNYHIPAELLNKKSELMAKSRHQNKFLLSNYKGND